MKVRHVLITLTALAIVAIIALAFGMGYGAGMAKGEQDAEKIRAERLAKAKEGAFTNVLFGNIDTTFTNVVATPLFNEVKPITANGFGKVVSSSMINITSEVQGVINSNIILKKGTKFKKGQLLFSINNQDVKMALQARKSGYLTLLTNILPDLKLDHNDNFEAWLKFYNAFEVDKPLPPLPETKSFKEKNFIISRNIYSEYYNILSDQERLKKYTIVAPFDGSVLDAFTDNGAITAPGSQVLAVIREGNMEIEVPISANEIDLVKLNADVKLYDEVGSIARGKVSRKGSYINPLTQTVPVFIELTESSMDLYNGMYLNADIQCDGFESLIEIPRKAIFNKNEVYVVKNNRIFSTSVDIQMFQENTVLARGIKDGTIIVLEPILNAKDSMEVRILNPVKN